MVTQAHNNRREVFAKVLHKPMEVFAMAPHNRKGEFDMVSHNVEERA